jgi:hypothetical protein
MILVVFLVEIDFKFEIEEVFHMRQWNVISGATSWWHVGRVIDSHAEEAFQARVAHAVAARKFCSLV